MNRPCSASSLIVVCRIEFTAAMAGRTGIALIRLEKVNEQLVFLLISNSIETRQVRASSEGFDQELYFH